MRERFLRECDYMAVPRPPIEQRNANLDLVRSKRDVSLALALLDAQVDIFVTNDRDFTDTGATANRFAERVRVMLPGAFLTGILGWSSNALEAIRNRRWQDLPDEEDLPK
jgi:hypothetical protein